MSRPSPIDLDRVRGFFRDNHVHFAETGTGYSLVTRFSGVAIEIRHTPPNVALVSSAAVDDIGADRFDDVLAWVERYNDSHTFPTTTAIQDRDRRITALGVTFVLPGQWGYTDEQFADWVGSGINGVVDAVTSFVKEFSPEALAQLRERS